MFQKGISGNPNGRPKALDTKERKRLKEIMILMFERNLNELEKHESQLSIKDRIELLKIMSPFIMPRLQTIYLEPEDNNEDYFKSIQVNIIK
jgi:hypothetical protein